MAFKDVKECLKSFPEETQEKALEVICDFMSSFTTGLDKEQCANILDRLDGSILEINDIIGILTLTDPEALSFTINRFKTNCVFAQHEHKIQ